MNNLNNIVDYLKVFNNIETYKSPGPRTMAQEPRIIGKPGGVVEPGIEYYGDNVITYTGQGEHKGEYHLRLGADKKIHRGTKEELEIILKEEKRLVVGTYL